jgi:serine/threonine protein kinase
MSENELPGALPTNFTDDGYARFEADWLARKSGDPLPNWQDYLPAADAPCTADLVRMIVEVDIECRIKAGLPALLSQRYFEHPRLQQNDARLNAEQQMELIEREYQLRWQHGQPARRAEYEAAFPQHADAVRRLKPHLYCSKCRQLVAWEETDQTLVCPRCDGVPISLGGSSATPTDLDLRVYQLIEELGRGGMGDVYRSCDPALGRDLAIKVIKAECCEHPVYVRRFLREARITGSLQHPSIVAVHNLGRLPDGRLHYTMRLVRGRTFADILQEEAGKPERLPALLDIFKNICQAVGYAHSKRVIHRDLKPLNVMVGKFGEVQVMDWGLAKLLTADEEETEPEETPDAAGTHIHTEPAETPLDLTRRGSEFGSPPYMPPEQALGEWSLVDERADVFALGSILCELLTGKAVYTGHNRDEVLWKAKRGDVAEALSWLEQCGADAALTALCRECLAVEHQQRPRDAGVVGRRVADYQAAVEQRLRQAELERTEAEVKRGEGRKRRRLAVLLSSAVLIVFVVGTLISLLLAFDAHRQADAARKYAEDAENEKLRADKKTKEAETEKSHAERALDEAEQNLVAGLLRTIGWSDHRLEAVLLNDSERDSLTMLSEMQGDRTILRFFEEGLRTAKKAWRLDLQHKRVIQAAVGLNLNRRYQVEALLMRTLRKHEAPPEVRSACIMLGSALDIQDPEFDKYCEEIIISLANNAIVNNAIRYREFSDLNDRLMEVGKRLHPATSAKAARLIVDAMGKIADPLTLRLLSAAFASVSEGLDSSLAANAADQIVNALGKTTDKDAIAVLIDALSSLIEHLDRAVSTNYAARAADLFMNAMNKDKVVLGTFVSSGLAKVGIYLDASSAAKTASFLVTAMINNPPDDPQLDLILPPTSPLVSLLSTLESVSQRLDAAGAAKASDMMVTAMVKNPRRFALSESMSRALASVGKSIDASSAAKAVDMLMTAIVSNPDPVIVSSLSRALALMFERLDGYAAATPAAKVAYWVMNTLSKTTDAVTLSELSKSMASVGVYLNAQPAAKAANLIMNAMSKTDNAVTLSSLANGMASVIMHMDQAVAAVYGTKAAALLMNAMSKTTDTTTIRLLTRSLISLRVEHLEPASALKVADLIMSAMGKSNVQASELTLLWSDLVSAIKKMGAAEAATYFSKAVAMLIPAFRGVLVPNDFQKTAERLSTLDILVLLRHPLIAGTAQRVLLDILGHRTRRHFRNSWHFLDWARSNGIDFAPAH